MAHMVRSGRANKGQYDQIRVIKLFIKIKARGKYR